LVKLKLSQQKIKKNKIAQIITHFLSGPTSSEKRTPNQLREHYEIERKLANKLLNASKEERGLLYSALYDELYRRVPNHPQLTRKESNLSDVSASQKIVFLRRFITSDTKFLEIGPGDCIFSFEVAKRVKKVYAIDVSEEITRTKKSPQNFELIISDGCDIPVPENSIDMAYSNNLMEHLHPEDAYAQLRNIYEALTDGGKYLCITPNCLSGPHDISRYFSDKATGFHLKEYTVTELSQLFQRVGFRQLHTYVGGDAILIRFPMFSIEMCEKTIGLLPFLLRKRVSRMLPFRVLLGITILALK
jgi:ubiquinone/menaquinone biosynthesis C-methylase UbiE